MDQQDKFVVRLATNQDDYKKLSDFRIVQFENNKEYTVIDPKLLSQLSGFIFIVENPDTQEIVSSMQVEYINSASHFMELYSDYYRFKPDNHLFPSFYISKVATKKQLRNIGFNSYLRLQVLKITKYRNDIKTLTGIVFEGGPRVALMHSLGYLSQEIKMESSGYLLPNVETTFMWLDKEKFDSAIAFLKNHTNSAEPSYEIKNEYSLSEFFDLQTNRKKTQVFIGSTVEQVNIARIIREKLGKLLQKTAEIIVWDDDFFENNKSPLENITKKAEKLDFAILLLTGDDKTESRGETFASPRDNMIFELGFFIGVLGRNRTFGILDKRLVKDVFSDMRGITVPILEYDSSNLDESLNKTCEFIMNDMYKNGFKRIKKDDFGVILNYFDYETFTREIKFTKDTIRILITYIFPFTDNVDFSDLKKQILENLNHSLRQSTHLRIEFLFLNPYSPSMELRIKDRELSSQNIPKELLETYSFFYKLKYGPEYSFISKRITIKVYNQMPPFAMFQLDDSIQIASYPKAKPVHNGRWLQLNSKTDLGRSLTDKFSQMLKDNTDCFDINYCFFITIKNKQIHYIKNKTQFYLALSDKLAIELDLVDNNTNNKIKFYWFGHRLEGVITEITKLEPEIQETLELKFSGEAFSKYYQLLTTQSEAIFSIRKNLTL